MKLNELKKTYWLEHIEAAKKSNKGVAAYCRQMNVSTRVFYYWRSRLNPKGLKSTPLSSKSSFVPVSIQKKTIHSKELPNPEWLARFLSEYMRATI